MNSKRKGSEFERTISKKLSLWFSNNTNQYLFWRTHSSGALATVSKVKSQECDISLLTTDNTDCNIFIDNFIIECKFYKKIEMPLFEQNNKIILWFDTLQTISNTTKKIPLLIAKSNYKDILVFTNYDGFDIFHPFLNNNIIFMRNIESTDNCKNSNYLFIFKFDDMLKINITDLINHISEIRNNKNPDIESSN